jgi:copper(I)-binding protein
MLRRPLSVTATSRPGRRIACVALLAAIPLTACAAGYQAETSRERTTLTSVSAAKGNLTLRNIFFVGPASSGENMPLYLAIFNGGTSSDKLMSISSSSFSGGFVPSDTSIQGNGQKYYNEGDGDVPQLIGAKNLVRVGQTVNVTLNFQQAGELTITVPVEAATNGLPGPSPTPTPSPTESASASPSASPSAASSASPSAASSASPSVSASP